MGTINLGNIFSVILSGVGTALVVFVVGMVLWYVKAKPRIDAIETDLAKKAAAAEVARLALEIERKRNDDMRIESSIHEKRRIDECDLIRKGCQPLLLEKLENIDSKLEKWMLKNGR